MVIRNKWLFTAVVLPALVLQPLIGSAQEFEFSFGRDRRGGEEYGGGCSPRQALRVARRIGVKDAQISSITGQRIIIDGYGWENEYVQLYLANRSGCPRIR